MPTRWLSEAQRRRYARFDGPPTDAQLARYFHLDTADRTHIDTLRGGHNRLGFAVQLGTVRFLGILPPPPEIPDVVVRNLAWQLGLEPIPCLRDYHAGRPRKRHTALIRAAYGYRELADDPLAGFRLVRWQIDPADVARLSPLIHRHINFLGRYAFVLPEGVAAGEMRPLNEPTSE